MNKSYKTIHIAKHKRAFRKVVSLSEEYNTLLKSYLPELENLFFLREQNTLSYGFIPGRNCVENARQHIGYELVLSLDIKNFFDCIDESHAGDILPNHIVKDCFIGGILAQGMPTSPIISNILFISIDEEINDFLKKTIGDFSYSRYADDLTFGFRELEYIETIELKVMEILSKYSFYLNSKKTKLQRLSGGRIIICGVAIDESSVYPTRKTLRKIRAAAHQKNYSSLIGLKEWAKCKVPSKRSNESVDEVKRDGGF